MLTLTTTILISATNDVIPKYAKDFPAKLPKPIFFTDSKARNMAVIRVM